VVERADDAARQEDGGREDACLGRRSHANEPEAGEQEGDDDSGEHLEEPLDPQVYYPPPPVLDRRQVAAAAVAQGGDVEHGDGNRRDQEQGEQRPLVVGLA
jgi:hypothetical protein